MSAPPDKLRSADHRFCGPRPLRIEVRLSRGMNVLAVCGTGKTRPQIRWSAITNLFDALCREIPLSLRLEANPQMGPGGPGEPFEGA